MLLYIQFSDKGLVFGSLNQTAVVWKEGPVAKDPFPALVQAMKQFGTIRPQGVVCGLPTKEGELKASWSTVRAAVAMVNGLAFAWGVPAASIEINGQESKSELEEKIRSIKLVPGFWVKATYSGEPNITKPKRLLC